MKHIAYNGANGNVKIFWNNGRKGLAQIVIGRERRLN